MYVKVKVPAWIHSSASIDQVKHKMCKNFSKGDTIRKTIKKNKKGQKNYKNTNQCVPEMI